jgi:NAD(P)-dependent dehydrogenase (short-subunit alcohol dehydrogenase family)
MENITKHALITGGTSGVGLSIVKALVKHNYKVTFIGSNLAKGKAVESQLTTTSTLEHKFVQLDLGEPSAVKAFTVEFIKHNNTLDLLVNVAGIMSPKQQLTQAGQDKTFAIGYLSAFILSTALTPLLENGNQSRIVNVSGQPSHVLKPVLDFDNLDFKTNYGGFKTAIATVHAKTVLTQILAEKLISKNIDVNSFNPGFVQSDLSRNMPKLLQLLAKLASPFMAKTSKTGIFVCIDDSIKHVSGKLFVNEKPTTLCFDLEYREKLWNATEKIINSI